MKRLELIKALKENPDLDICAPIYGKTMNGEPRLMGYVFLDKKDLLGTLEQTEFFTDIFLDTTNQSKYANWYVEKEDYGNDKLDC